MLFNSSQLMVVRPLTTTARRWVRSMKGDNPAITSLHDEAHSGRPKAATDAQHEACVDKLICTNSRVKQKDIAVMVGISLERVHHVIHVSLVIGKCVYDETESKASLSGTSDWTRTGS
ncbi:Uncharacterised protein at_DN0106 [Pycnogonum litorale]